MQNNIILVASNKTIIRLTKTYLKRSQVTTSSWFLFRNKENTKNYYEMSKIFKVMESDATKY